jgi:hypothetical protein
VVSVVSRSRLSYASVIVPPALSAGLRHAIARIIGIANGALVRGYSRVDDRELHLSLRRNYGWSQNAWDSTG